MRAVTEHPVAVMTFSIGKPLLHRTTLLPSVTCNHGIPTLRVTSFVSRICITVSGLHYKLIKITWYDPKVPQYHAGVLFLKH